VDHLATFAVNAALVASQSQHCGIAECEKYEIHALWLFRFLRFTPYSLRPQYWGVQISLRDLVGRVVGVKWEVASLRQNHFQMTSERVVGAPCDTVVLDWEERLPRGARALRALQRRNCDQCIHQ